MTEPSYWFRSWPLPDGNAIYDHDHWIYGKSEERMVLGPVLTAIPLWRRTARYISDRKLTCNIVSRLIARW